MTPTPSSLQLLANGQITARALLEERLAIIAQKEPEIKAFLTLRPNEELLAEADSADQKRSTGGPLGPLLGLPIAIKDNICTKGIRTSCASKMLDNFVPPYNATVIEKLREAGAIIVGKTNMDEFAMGSTTEHSAFGHTANPLNVAYTPGGSSGGSAAAVGSGMVPLALGSDTGGSIRQPAAFCGVVGMKPTYGRVSRYGLVAYGSSLDQIGPLAGTVAEASALFKAIAGYDARDSTSLESAVYDSNAIGEKKSYTFGLPNGYMSAEGLDEEIKVGIFALVEKLKEAGHTVVEVEMPDTTQLLSTYYLIACAEASSNLSRYDGVKYGHRTKEAGDLKEMYIKSRDEGFGDEVKRRIMLGTYILSKGYYDAYYLKAQKSRTLIREEIRSLFGKCDAILSPISPTLGIKIGEKIDDPIAMYLTDIYSVSANLAGVPAITLPIAPGKEGLAVGVQLMGDIMKDEALLGIAETVESIVGS